MSGPGGFAAAPTRTLPALWLSRSRLADLVLRGVTLLALLRATGMWFGLPSSQEDAGEIDPRPLQLLLYSLIPLTIVYVLLARRHVTALLRSARAVPIIIVFFCVVSVLLAAQPSLALRGFVAVVTVSTPVLLYRLRFGTAETLRLLRQFLSVAIVANVLYAYAFPHFGIMSGALAGAMKGLFPHKNMFGQVSAITCILLLPAFRPPLLRYSTIIQLGIAVLALFGVLRSLSTTSVMLLIVGFAAYAMTAVVARLPGEATRTYSVIASIVLILVVGATVGPMVLEFVTSSAGKDTTFSGRSEIWDDLVPAILEHPIIGHGFLMFRQPDYIKLYTSGLAWDVYSTHSTFLELMLNIGVPASVLLIGYIFRRVLSRASAHHTTPLESANGRAQVAVMLMVLVGAFSEAGIILSVSMLWVTLLAMLPASEPPARRSLG